MVAFGPTVSSKSPELTSPVKVFVAFTLILCSETVSLYFLGIVKVTVADAPVESSAFTLTLIFLSRLLVSSDHFTLVSPVIDEIVAVTFFSTLSSALVCLTEIFAGDSVMVDVGS